MSIAAAQARLPQEGIYTDMLNKFLQNRIMIRGMAYGRRLLAFVLSLVMLISLLPSVGAAAAEKNVEDLYLLRVDTGTASGKNIMYIGVRFTDSSGKEHTEFIFPHEGDLGNSYALAASYGSPSERLNTVNAVTRYTVAGYEKMDGLRSDSMDMYLFSPHYEISSFIGLDIFMRYPTDGSLSNGWTCKGVYLYEVDVLKGLGMAGYYSNDYYVQFQGTMLGKLKSDAETVDFTLNKSDVLYRVGRETDAGYEFVGPEAGKDEEHYSNIDGDSEYLMKIDFADVYDGGIEALASEMDDNQRLMYPVEVLTVALTYIDSYGKPRYVNLPAVTSALGWAVETGKVRSNLPIAGIAQQGESLIFPCDLPDFETLYDIQLIYGPEAADTAGVTVDIGMRGKERLNKAKNESCYLSGITLYGKDAIEQVKRGPSPASLDLYVEEDCKPLYYYTASLKSGDQISAGGTGFQMKPYSPKAPLKPVSSDETFIVKIMTDNIPAAATTEDLQFCVTYLSTDGSVKTTPEISLREAAQEFYGYWPGTSGNVPYLAGVSAGGTLVFPIQIGDVQRFQSATFRMDSKAQDDWQMSEIMIFCPKTIGSRSVEWKDIGISNREITRIFDDSDNARVAWYPNPADIAAAGDNGPEKIFMNGKNNRKTVTFSGAGGGGGGGGGNNNEKDNPVINWNDIQYSMTYKEALQDFGFATSAVTYTVNVQVASNDGIGASDDSGSRNLFYFKLIFENGSSGYVLANQQLTADGFRAGRIETFYISTNYDYGALSAVSIIPETESNSDNQDVFDKLNIQDITVTRVSGTKNVTEEDSDNAGGMSRFWKVGNVGWIGIEYFDKGAESAPQGRAGSTEGELSRIYSVTGTGYALNLLFAITTGSYDKRITDITYSPGAKYPQYEGTLTATIEYYDSDKILRKMNVDVARAMYEYADMTPKYLDDGEGQQLPNAYVDTSFMLREGHTDRFIVNIPDVTQVVRIHLYASGLVSTRWKVEDIGVWQILSDGVLQLTSMGEYRRTNTIEEICHSTSTIGYTLETMAPDRKEDILGEEQALPVRFSYGLIDVTSENGEWSTNIQREPTNRNDTLNLYVYMKDEGSYVTSILEYNLDAVLQYTNSQDGNDYQVSMQSLKKDYLRNMFYAVGLRADGMSTVNKLILNVDTYSRVNAPVDYIVLQHVRSGVVLSTHVIQGEDPSAGLKYNLAQPLEVNPSTYGDTAAQQEQIVRLCFSPEMTETVEVSPENKDVAIAIRYKTVNDIGDISYNSRYVYLSDIKTLVNGTEVSRYGKITPGMIAEIPFSESYVSEILGVMVASLGGINVTLDSACVGVYDSGSGDLLDWYNFAEPLKLSEVPQMMPVTEDTVAPVMIRFTTYASAKVVSSDSDGGRAAPIRMTVEYIDRVSGERETITYEDIRNYLTEGSFTVGEKDTSTATIRFFLKNADSLRSIILEPYTVNPYGSASWGLGTCYCEAVIGNEKMSCSVKRDELVVQESPVSIYFSTVLVELDGSFYDPEYGITYHSKTNANGEAELTIASGETAVIIPKINGSAEGYIVEAQQKIGDALRPVYCFQDITGNIRFAPPENTTENSQTYIVTVKSKEMPEVSASMTIYVLPSEKPPEEEEPEEEEPEVPEEPEEEEPEVPEVQEVQEEPEVPEVQEVQEEPEVPEVQEVQEEPEVPEEEVPEVPEEPGE